MVNNNAINFKWQKQVQLHDRNSDNGVHRLEALLVVGLPDPEWGQRLIGLVKPSPGANGDAVMALLQQRSASLPPAQRPKQWLLCPQLAPNPQGKWERQRWRAWTQA